MGPGHAPGAAIQRSHLLTAPAPHKAGRQRVWGRMQTCPRACSVLGDAPQQPAALWLPTCPPSLPAKYGHTQSMLPTPESQQTHFSKCGSHRKAERCKQAPPSPCARSATLDHSFLLATHSRKVVMKAWSRHCNRPHSGPCLSSDNLCDDAHITDEETEATGRCHSGPRVQPVSCGTWYEIWSPWHPATKVGSATAGQIQN